MNCEHDQRFHYQWAKIKGGTILRPGDEIPVEFGCLLCDGKTLKEAEEYIRSYEATRPRV